MIGSYSRSKSFVSCATIVLATPRPPVDGVAVHDGGVHVSDRFQRAADDVLGLVDRDITAGLGAQ